MKKEYQQSDELEVLADQVIDNKKMNKILDSNATIGYLLVYPNINKRTVGRCIRIRNEMNFLTGMDYIIEMSGDIWDNLSDTVRELVMEHELRHVSPEYNEKKGEWTYKIKDHTVQDFYAILNKHGLDWFTELKTITSSVRDLKPEDEDNIKI